MKRLLCLLLALMLALPALAEETPGLLELMLQEIEALDPETALTPPPDEDGKDLVNGRGDVPAHYLGLCGVTLAQLGQNERNTYLPAAAILLDTCAYKNWDLFTSDFQVWAGVSTVWQQWSVIVLDNSRDQVLQLFWTPGSARSELFWYGSGSEPWTVEAFLASDDAGQLDRLTRLNRDQLLSYARELMDGTFSQPLRMGALSFDISEDRQHIFVNRPALTGGSGKVTIAYNIYDADSNPVNYFYSDAERVAATPGYGGVFNVFVVVRDSGTGEEVSGNIGWQTLSWPPADRLEVGKVSFTLSEDKESVFLTRPDIRCRSGKVSIAYNIYDSASNPVNYFYSTQRRVAATPGYYGKFNVFVVVTDLETGETVTQDIGWTMIGLPPDEDPYSERNVRDKMLAMKAQYPEGMHWTNADKYVIHAGGTYIGYGCVAFAYILSDAAFSGLPLRTRTSFTWDDVRVGDMLRINNNTHHVIVLEKHDDYVVIAEGNYNSSIHWGRTLTREKVEQSDYLTTRYPK